MFEQERMIGRLQRRVAADPDIYACFLSGSFGRRASDDYSDLDVTLVFNSDPALENAWRNRGQFSKSIMPYISIKAFDANQIRPYCYSVLYANGSKLDLRWETRDALDPNPWDSKIRILKDTEGWAESYQAQSSLLPLPQTTISHQELTLLDQRFWVMYWDVLRLMARDDAEKSFPIYLNMLQFTFPPLLEALPPQTPIRTKLIDACFRSDRDMRSRNMKGLLHAYLEARQVLIEYYHLQFVGDKSFENQIQRLVEKLT